MTQVKDPVCGVLVEAGEGDGVEYRGITYYFCSEEHRREFSSNPEVYSETGAPSSAEAAGFTPERHEPPRTTIGKITAPKFGSAGSGGAEYEPLPERHEEGEVEEKRSRKRRNR